jgi:hypothetical protein
MGRDSRSRRMTGHGDSGNADANGASAVGNPDASLEPALIDEFLAKPGHTSESPARLPAGTREPVLRGGLRDAGLTPAEVGTRAQMIDEIGRRTA